jgi:hypothetical protein
MKFSSAAGQDRFLFETFFKGRRAGTFVEVNATEGGGHTRFFERDLDWRGLRVHPRLACGELGEILERDGLRGIDLCAIDASGSEREILQKLDFDRFRIGVLCVRAEPIAISGILRARGYELVARLDADSIFKHREIPILASATVICAVWHQDPARWDLLRGHAANLARQTVPIERIYVFDGEDEPPSWLPGRKIAVRDSLSIYQAWNVALSLVHTPLVMNLNLDDRLAPDAIATLYGAMARNAASLAGGDWKICYTQADTDAVAPSYPAERLPCIEAWPPPAGTPTRLGSGTGARGTFGPAVLWRLDAHIGAPRYPWRLADGSLLRIAGDAVWWSLMQDHLRKKVLRVPMIIGHYHSHPATQAEFRSDVDEMALYHRMGPSLL